MRKNQLITFYQKNNDVYNPETGKHESKPEIVKQLWANVTDGGVKKNIEMFGTYNVETKTIRMAESIDFDWSYLCIGYDSTHYVAKANPKGLKINSIIVGSS